jgi:hypothetical protein
MSVKDQNAKSELKRVFFHQISFKFTIKKSNFFVFDLFVVGLLSFTVLTEIFRTNNLFIYYFLRVYFAGII